MANTKDKIRASAQKFLQKGQIDKAIREFQRLVEEDPKDVRTLLKIGDLQTRIGSNNEATQTYGLVAQFYADQGFLLKAVAVYKQILKLDPNLIEINVKLAELYHQLGLMSDAAGQYRQISQIYEQAGRHDDSIKVLARLVEIDPENVAGRIKLAESYAKKNLLVEARTEFAKAAELLKQQHRVDDYIKVAERMIHFDPGDLHITRELANIYIQKGDARRALAKLQVCFKANPKDVETLGLLATAFKDLAQPAKTISVYREIGRIHEASGDTASFQSVMRRILAIDPDDVEARKALGSVERASPQVSTDLAGGPTTPPPRRTGPGVAPSAQAPAGQSAGDAPRSSGEISPAQIAAMQAIAAQGAARRGTSEVSPAQLAQKAPVPENAPQKAPLPENALGRIVPTQKAVQGKAEQPVQEIDRRPPPVEAAGDDIEVDTDFDEIDGDAVTADADGLNDATRETVTRILVESEVYVKYGLKQKAVDHLRKIFAIAPDHREARSRYKSLLVETSALEEAADVLMSMAAVALQGGDSSTARSDLEELLGIAPAHAGARELLAKLSPAATSKATPAPPAEHNLDQDDLEVTEDVGGDDYVPEHPASSSGTMQALSYEPSEEAAEIDLDADDDEIVGVELATDDDGAQGGDGIIVEEPGAGGIILDEKIEDGIIVGAPDEAGDDAEGITFEVGSDDDEAPVIPDQAAAERALHFEEEQPSIELDGQPALLDSDALPETLDEPVAAEQEAERPPSPATVPAEVRPAAEAKPEAPRPSELKPAPAKPAAKPVSQLDADLDALINSAVPARRKTEPDPLGIQTPKGEPPRAQGTPVAAARAPAAPPEPVRAEVQKPEPAPAAVRAPVDLSGEIAEIGFYLEQDLQDEAREMLATLRAEHPDHPELLALAAKLDGAATSPAAPAVDYEPEPEMQIGDALNDIAADLQFAAAADDDDTSLDDVFDAFKKGVAESVEEADYATHYDLGIAYKEMELLTDAIREFELAARDPTREIGALTMMGLCALQSGDIEHALRYFQRGLNSESVTAGEAMALRYEIGVAYEGAGRHGEAGKFYEKVHAWDETFRDVDERLRRAREQDSSGNVISELDELLTETEAERASRSKISYV